MGGILFEVQGVILDDASEEVGTDEGEKKDGGEQSPGFCATQFFDAGFVQEGADLEIVEEGGDVIGHMFCLLQFANKFSINHGSLFFPILLMNFAKPNIPESKRLFTLKMKNFQ